MMETSKARSERKGGSAAVGIENYGKALAKLRREGKDPRIAGGRDWVGKSLTDPVYRLWEKEQVVVLLSRTVSAKDIVFVGSPSPRETIDAILQVIQSISGGHQRRLTALSVCNSK
jgi:hypothetical protein